MLADTPINVAARAIVRVEHAQITRLGVVGSGEVRRATNRFLHDRVNHLQRHFRGLARCHFRCALAHLLFERFDRCREFLWCVQCIGAVELRLLVARN